MNQTFRAILQLFAVSLCASASAQEYPSTVRSPAKPILITEQEFLAVGAALQELKRATPKDWSPRYFRVTQTSSGWTVDVAVNDISYRDGGWTCVVDSQFEKVTCNPQARIGGVGGDMGRWGSGGGPSPVYDGGMPPLLRRR